MIESELTHQTPWKVKTGLRTQMVFARSFVFSSCTFDHDSPLQLEGPTAVRIEGAGLKVY
jgi:hypothetical protein